MTWTNRFNKLYYLETKVPKVEILNALKQRIAKSHQTTDFSSFFQSREFKEMSIIGDRVFVNDVYSFRSLINGSILMEVSNNENGSQIFAELKLRIEAMFIPAIGGLVGTLLGFTFLKWPSLANNSIIFDWFTISVLIAMAVWSVAIVPVSIVFTKRKLKDRLTTIFWELGIKGEFREMPR